MNKKTQKTKFTTHTEMKPIWKQIIVHTILKPKRIKTGKDKKYSDFELARGMREFKRSIIRHIKDFILITRGIFSAAFGFKGFLLTNHLLTVVRQVFHF